MELDVAWILAWASSKKVLKSKLFKFMLLAPFLLPMLVVPFVLLKYRVEPRSVLVQFEPLHRESAELVRELIESPGTAGNAIYRYPVTLEEKSVSEMERLRLSNSERIRSGDLMAFVEIRSEIATSSRAGLYWYSESQGGEATGVAERLNTYAKLLERNDFTAKRKESGRVGDDSSFHFCFPIRESGKEMDRAAQVRLMGQLSVVILLLTALQLSSMFCVAPLIQGLSKEKESRALEVMLSVTSGPTVLLGKFLEAGIIFLILSTWYCSLVIAPALYFGLITPISVLLFAVFAGLTFTLQSGLSIAVGAISGSPKDAIRIKRPLEFLSLVLNVGVLAVIKMPNSLIATALTFIPATAPYVVLLRSVLATNVAWSEIVLSMLFLMVLALLSAAVGVRVFKPEVLLSGERLGWKKLFCQVVRNRLEWTVQNKDSGLPPKSDTPLATVVP